MKTLRALAAVSIVMLVAACASTSEKGAPPKAPPAPPAANVSGSWTVSVDSPMGKRDSEAQFSQSGEALTGKMISQRGEVPFTGTVKGNAVAFAFTIDMQGQALKLDYTGTVTGDTMSGAVKFGDFGEGTWTAKKK